MNSSQQQEEKGVLQKLIAVFEGTADEATRKELLQQYKDPDSELHLLLKGLEHAAENVLGPIDPPTEP